MVVDDVEDDRDAERVRAIDKAAEIVRPAVEPGRREQIDPVIAPAEAAGEIGDRHQLDAGDAERGQFGQFARSRLPAPLRGEAADMHLVDDQLLARTAAPVLVGPAERAGIDDFRRPVRPFRLKARGRVGEQPVERVGAEAVAQAGTRIRRPGPE